MPDDPTWDDLLKRLPMDQLEALYQRLQAARAMAKRPRRTHEDVEEAARAVGVAASTLYRDMRRLEGDGTVRDLVPRARGYPKGRARLQVRQEELIQQALRSHHLSLHRPPLAETIGGSTKPAKPRALAVPVGRL